MSDLAELTLQPKAPSPGSLTPVETEPSPPHQPQV
jgi:hypothetical protein